MKIASFIYIFLICYLIGCNISRSTKPCTQCPQYTQEIDRLNKEIEDNQVIIDQIEKDYYVLWEENQIFASMLSEIEGSKEGHDELKYLFNKYKTKRR